MRLEYYVWQRTRHIGLPDPVLALALPSLPARSSAAAVPHDLRHGFILSCASLPSRVSRATSARSLPAPGTFLGVLPPIAASTSGVHSHDGLLSHRRVTGVPGPLRSVLDVSHVLDGFLLRQSSWVYFTPQPRPGFALQGFPSPRSRTGSSPAVALVSLRLSPAPVLPTAPETCARLQGLAPRVDPLRDMVV